MKKICQICGRDSSKVEIVSAVVVRPIVGELIKSSNPNWDAKGFICKDDLRKFRNEYLYKIMEDEKGELSSLEEDVINKLTEYETISVNLEKGLIQLHLWRKVIR